MRKRFNIAERLKGLIEILENDKDWGHERTHKEVAKARKHFEDYTETEILTYTFFYLAEIYNDQSKGGEE